MNNVLQSYCSHFILTPTHSVIPAFIHQLIQIPFYPFIHLSILQFKYSYIHPSIQLIDPYITFLSKYPNRQPSTFLSNYTPIYPYQHPSTHPLYSYILPPTHPCNLSPIYLPPILFIHPPPIHLSIHTPIKPSTYPSTNPSTPANPSIHSF